jgi:beta-glucanase (GH16 family)
VARRFALKFYALESLSMLHELSRRKFLGALATAATVPSRSTTGATHYGTSPPSRAPTGWTERFFEDFNSWHIAGGLDGSSNPYATTDAHPEARWQLVPIPGTYCVNPNREQEWYCSPAVTPGINPFSQSGSVLRIAATTGSDVKAAVQAGALRTRLSPLYNDYVAQGMQDPPFASGGINTSNFLNPKYGYFELKCRQPSGLGMWTAFWTHPSPGEFDIFESVGGRHNRMGYTAHHNRCFPSRSACVGAVSSNAGNGYLPDLDDTTADFHVYGGLWTPNYLAWYYDGRLVFRAPATVNGVGGFATPSYIIINFAMGTGMGSARTPASALPAYMDVDWFRYSQLGPA